ncbi:MAG: hypothetical protein AAGG68_27805 [Bacteroidota bacterium]
MKNILFLTLSSLLLIFSCQKEDIDEIIVNDFNFEPDTLVEKNGFIRVKIDEKIVIDEPGYAFICNATHRNEVNYMISNDFSNSFAFFNHPSSRSTESNCSFRWTVCNEEKNSFILPLGFVNETNDNYSYFTSLSLSGQDTIESVLEFTITRQSLNHIQGSYQGKLREIAFSGTEGRIVDVSGEFNLPLYKNCEIGLPIGTGKKPSSTLYLPYDLPQIIDVDHIICTEGEKQRNLISTVPATFLQFDEAPHSLLQNEYDYYIYWEQNDALSEVLDFECKVMLKLPHYKGIAELSNYQDAKQSFEKRITLQNSFKSVFTTGVLKAIKSGKVLGLGATTAVDVEIETIDCQ